MSEKSFIESANAFTQNSKNDLNYIDSLISKKESFCFLRFSDGEIEIIRNYHLVIGDGFVTTSAGSVAFSYPPHDFKEFNPARDADFRLELLNSAQFISNKYFKGIRTGNNYGGEIDKQLMISLNRDSLYNLTFTDLLINSNYLTFRKKLLPKILQERNVYLIANFRANLTNVPVTWHHIPIPDNFIPEYKSILDSTLTHLKIIEPGSLVLSSASSLSNLIGNKIWEFRQDITFMDIGTAIHDLIGLGSSTRTYQVLLQPNSFSGLIKKLNYIIRGDYRIKW